MALQLCLNNYNSGHANMNGEEIARLQLCTKN